jgi:D-aminoacyl-tRNA deacylase
MELLVAYSDDPAGYNMAKFLSQKMKKDGDIFRGKNYDLLIISTPAIKADWLEEKYDYDGFIFLSKHAAESGVLALTCHSTGNFSEAKFGGNLGQMAIPHPDIQKKYLQTLWQNKSMFSDFQITIEATHHGEKIPKNPHAICFGGTHYPEKFTNELLKGKFALGTVMPKHALDNLDENLFSHIIERNQNASAALLDWGGLGPNKKKVLELLDSTNLEVIKL